MRKEITALSLRWGGGRKKERSWRCVGLGECASATKHTLEEGAPVAALPALAGGQIFPRELLLFLPLLALLGGGR